MIESGRAINAAERHAQRVRPRIAARVSSRYPKLSWTVCRVSISACGSRPWRRAVASTIFQRLSSEGSGGCPWYVNIEFVDCICNSRYSCPIFQRHANHPTVRTRRGSPNAGQKTHVFSGLDFHNPWSCPAFLEHPLEKNTSPVISTRRSGSFSTSRTRSNGCLNRSGRAWFHRGRSKQLPGPAYHPRGWSSSGMDRRRAPRPRRG